MYFISAAVILLASLALIVQVSVWQFYVTRVQWRTQVGVSGVQTPLPPKIYLSLIPNILKQVTPEEEQQQRWNTWEEQQDTLGQITKQMHKLQRS